MSLKLFSCLAIVLACLATIASAGGFDEAIVKPSAKDFILPKGFGNYTLESLSSASACGTVMATFNGINAYSNGDYQGTGNSCGGSGSTGLKYQVRSCRLVDVEVLLNRKIFYF
jgi:hypothetical protein